MVERGVLLATSMEMAIKPKMSSTVWICMSLLKLSEAEEVDVNAVFLIDVGW